MEKKIYWLDYIRFIACLMVVYLHVSAIYVQKTIGVFWEIGNFFDSFLRVCVPLFFMISGYLFFADKKVEIKNYVRLLIPLIFYSLIGIFVTYISFKMKVIGSFDVHFISKPAFYHLWYFYPLLLIYLISYFVKVRASLVAKEYLILLVIIIMIFCNPKVNDILELYGFNFNNFLFINGDFFYYFMYAVIGGVLRYVNTNFKVGVMGLLFYVLSSIFIFYLTSSTHDLIFYSYDGPLVVLGSLGLFVFFKSIIFFNKKPTYLVLLVSKYSLGIYVLHAFLLIFFEKLFNLKEINPLIGIFIFGNLIVLLSLICSVFIRRLDKNGYIS